MNCNSNVKTRQPIGIQNIPFLKEKDIFVEQLNGNILRKCVKMEEDEMKVIYEYFENELKDALDFVANDVDENLQDFVDLKARSDISKKRKLFQSGYINDNVRSNRTICDRQHCKSKLKEGKTDNVTSVCDDVQLDSAKKKQKKLKGISM